ncbi:MAG: bifunctional folylpolyglutamate synthase/dihydrofolate synthase [Acutalibacteraceae bacterium]
MNYNQSVNYIHSLLKFGVRPGLVGMDALLRLLGEPHKDLKCVHVAGTNGKGSVSTAISNVLIDAGYNAGLYTSPYVTDFLERIQFNGKPIDKNIFSKNVEKVKNAVEELSEKNVTVTEFEALTAVAFLCFKDVKCDVAVLEVGLGGRLDATNIIDTPLVNVITSLSIDHIGVLGDTIEKIAYEKCGTVKNGGKVVCSFGQPKSALEVVKTACAEKNNTLTVPNENDVDVLKSDIFGTTFVYKNREYLCKMSGSHQVKNMTCVIEACEILKDYFSISGENIANGIKAAKLPARVEVINKNPLVVLDGGHNEEGAKAFYDAVSGTFTEKENVYVVAGMMADKAVEKSLRPLMEKTTEFISVTPENPRSMSASELQNIAKKYCKNTVAIESPEEAVLYALNKLKPDGMLCVVGSLYLAGEVRETLLNYFKK